MAESTLTYPLVELGSRLLSLRQFDITPGGKLKQ